ncbi:MAG TPA: flagellar protein FlgN [Firmicutes bacterium]|nr:flagellar protein FlgN [Bacillota bacterium]
MKSYEEEVGLLSEVLEHLTRERSLIQRREMDALISSLKSREAILERIRVLRAERARLIERPAEDADISTHDPGDGAERFERLERIAGDVAAVYREIVEVDRENAEMLYKTRDRIELELRAVLKARDMANGYDLLLQPGPRFINENL